MSKGGNIRKWGPAALGLAGCFGHGPCLGLKLGDQVQVTVVDIEDVGGTNYDGGDPSTCGFGFDLSKGQVLIATVATTVAGKTDNCTTAAATFNPFGGWMWNFDASKSLGSDPDVLTGTYDATNGTCLGTTTVTITPADVGPDPYVSYVPQHGLMRRDFSGSGPGCPTSCYGYFSVNLKKL